MLVTAPLFFGGAQFAGMDMLVGGFISATTLLAGAYACAALGVLAKGLMAVALPGLVLVLWLLWIRRAALLWKLLWPPGLGLFAIIAAPWFIAMQLRFANFLHYFFVVQHVQR